MIRKDIEDRKDIERMVDQFYTAVRKDASLGPIFKEKIQDRWAIHLDIMYRFWETLLLNQKTYDGAPFRPHRFLPIGEQHFSKWLEIFSETVNALFEGPKAEEAIWRAQKMAELFAYKLKQQQDPSFKPLY
jgi:hemoglobin